MSKKEKQIKSVKNHVVNPTRGCLATKATCSNSLTFLTVANQAADASQEQGRNHLALFESVHHVLVNVMQLGIVYYAHFCFCVFVLTSESS